MLKLVKPHCFNKKEKIRVLQEKQLHAWVVLKEHSRSKRQKDVGLTEKRQTKEGDGGYD